MKIVVVVQARTGSSRLPGKVLMPLAGKPLLQRQIERIRSSTTPFELVVATTTDPTDDPVRELSKHLSIQCYSGHPTDLLDRHYRAGQMMKADAVVKIPSDCPLIDPGVIDRILFHWVNSADRLDFVSNLHPATYPDGNDIEIMSCKVLETAWREAKKDFEREHTTPFIWDQPERFRIENVAWETGLDYSMTHRWTIDYKEDYDFISAVYDALWNETRCFSLADILNLLEEKPELTRINASHAGINWYRNHLQDLRTVSESEIRKEDR